nr:MAG TPA: MtxA C-terminal domain, TPR, Big, signaling protein.03A [Caudoviricetes sp.]
MTQVYDMSAEEIRELVKQYIEHGVISRAIQCYERLLWLGKLQQREYLILKMMYAQLVKESVSKAIIKRYNKIYVL